MPDLESQQPRLHAEQTIDMSPESFREIGHKLIDDLADFLESLSSRKVTNTPSVTGIRSLLGQESAPEEGCSPKALVEQQRSLKMSSFLTLQ